jgi:hypothetical protein
VPELLGPPSLKPFAFVFLVLLSTYHFILTKLAILSDPHFKLPALKAIEELSQCSLMRIIAAGDVICSWPTAQLASGMR